MAKARVVLFESILLWTRHLTICREHKSVVMETVAGPVYIVRRQSVLAGHDNRSTPCGKDDRYGTIENVVHIQQTSRPS